MNGGPLGGSPRRTPARQACAEATSGRRRPAPAARGELRRGLPVGLVWGEADGEVLLDHDEAIRSAIGVIFERFAELGSARQVWLWLRRERVQFPLQQFAAAEVKWVTPSYHQVHSVLTNPVYAGA